MATTVRVQVVELDTDGQREPERTVLDIELARFTQGVQFGEISAAIQYAQDVRRREAAAEIQRKKRQAKRSGTAT